MKFQKLHLNMLVDRVIIGPTNPDNPEYRVYPAEVIRTVIKIIRAIRPRLSKGERVAVVPEELRTPFHSCLHFVPLCEAV